MRIRRRLPASAHRTSHPSSGTVTPHLLTSIPLLRLRLEWTARPAVGLPPKKTRVDAGPRNHSLDLARENPHQYEFFRRTATRQPEAQNQRASRRLRRNSNRASLQRHMMDNSYNHSLRFFSNDGNCFLGGLRKIDSRNVSLAYNQIIPPALYYWSPALTQENQWSRRNDSGLNLVPNQRQLGNCAHATAKRDESD